MRMVVDSNYLQCPELRQYLERSSENIAVLTDYASMEAYKGDTLTSIYKSMAILSEFPHQTEILRGQPPPLNDLFRVHETGLYGKGGRESRKNETIFPPTSAQVLSCLQLTRFLPSPASK